jgi:hypothetical protein
MFSLYRSCLGCQAGNHGTFNIVVLSLINSANDLAVSVRGNLFIAEMLFRVASQGNDLTSPVPFRRVSITAA